MIDFLIQRGKSTFFSVFDYLHVSCFDSIYTLFYQTIGKNFVCASDDENQRKLLGKIKLIASGADTDVKMITFMDILQSKDYQPNEEEIAFLAYYLEELPTEEKELIGSIDISSKIPEGEMAILSKFSPLQRNIIFCFSTIDREIKSKFLWEIHQYMLKKSRYYALSQLRAERVKDHQEEIVSILEMVKKEIEEGKDKLYLAYRVQEFFLEFQKRGFKAPSVQSMVSKIIVI
jgi:hypothetical protein